jgi:predicted nucleic acid-binding protein
VVSNYYLDTSALVKRYIDETGSAWLRALVNPAFFPVLVVSQLLIVEMTSAFNRRLREGTVRQDDYTRMVDAFRNDCLVEYRIMPFDESITNLACELLERHPLRAYDAIHLGTALVINRLLMTHTMPALTFLCADERLLNAAMAEGLAVDNPNHHP